MQKLIPCIVILFVWCTGFQENEDVPTPTVHEDGSVTFRRHAPDAESVSLSIETKAKPLPMTEGEKGTWSLTVDPLPPDIYAYYFFIDGKPAGEPASENKLPVITGGAQGLVHIRGDEELAWERGNEPKGKLEIVDYESKLIGEQLRFSIYLPAEYEKEDSKNYPVLYLLHGVMNDHQAWTLAGRAHVILDKLIAAEEAEPMIVVMPQGYGFPNAKERVPELFRTMNHKEWMERFANSLIDEIIPKVETRYRVDSQRKARAIAGLSMGGAQALHVGLNNPEQFGWVGCLSSAFQMYGGKIDSFLGAAKEASANELPEIWITTGKQDFVCGSNKSVVDWLSKNNIPTKFEETEGGHTWGLWRRALVKCAPGLFRNQ